MARGAIRGRSERLGATVGGSGLGAVFLVLLILGGTASAGPVAYVHRAPFKGTVVPSIYVYYNGCARARAEVPTFAMPTGNGSLLSSSRANSCNASASNYGYSSSDFAAKLPIALHFARPAVYVNISYNFVMNASFAHGRCQPLRSSGSSTCGADMLDSLTATAELLDQTTGNAYGPGTPFPGFGLSAYNTTNCLGRSCSSTNSTTAGNTSATGIFSWGIVPKFALNVSHRFAVELVVTVTVDSVCNAYGAARLIGCSVTAVADLDPPHGGLTLLSITEI